MEWDSPGIILSARRYGEGDALATVFTEAQGVHRGLAKGGLSRGKAAIWQAGNLAQLRWVARLSEQLGALTAELVHPSAALAMDDAVRLGVLTAACAEAEATLAERQPHPRAFTALLGLLAGLAGEQDPVAGLVRFEMTLLGELGYGLDLGCCAVSGQADGLGYVSPKSGRAVGSAHAGAWSDRLLKLPRFLVEDVAATAEDRLDGLRLTGHFLARDAFGAQHKTLPPARERLVDRLRVRSDQAAASQGASETAGIGRANRKPCR